MGSAALQSCSTLSLLHSITGSIQPVQHCRTPPLQHHFTTAALQHYISAALQGFPATPRPLTDTLSFVCRLYSEEGATQFEGGPGTYKNAFLMWRRNSTLYCSKEN